MDVHDKQQDYYLGVRMHDPEDKAMENDLRGRLLGRDSGTYSTLQSRRIATAKKMTESYASNNGWHSFSFMLDPTYAALPGEQEVSRKKVENGFNRQLQRQTGKHHAA